jgi:hypothetical protein
MKIAYFDIFYLINDELHQDRKEILMYDHQKHLSKEIPPIDDLRDLEMYEIMRLPIIRLPFKKEDKAKNMIEMRLEVLCCSYSSDCSFIYLFSGDKWNYFFYLK